MFHLTDEPTFLLLEQLGIVTISYGEGNGNPLQCSCLENHRDRWAAISGVAQSRTRLKRLSSSSSIYIPGEGNGNHSSIFAWKTPWTEESGELQSVGSQRVEHD